MSEEQKMGIGGWRSLELPLPSSEPTRGGFMKNAIEGKHYKAGRPASASVLACLIATFSASIFAVMLSISIGLSWPGYLMLTFTAAALSFGVVFTIFEMRRLEDNRR
jgi:hypothetical protein